jgi:hypothetical protein
LFKVTLERGRTRLIHVIHYRYGEVERTVLTTP